MPVHTAKYVTVAGKKTSYVEGGSGPRLVYLHSAGGETEWTSWHDALAARFTVIAPAHPGFGDSQGLDEIDNFADYLWHYVDFFAALELKRVPVVGFSLGAWIGVELAILRPELVSRLVMICAAGLHVPGHPMGEYFTDDTERLKKLVYHDPNHPSVREVFPTGFDDPRILLWLRAREATARVAWNPYLHNPKLPRHLSRVAAPTLLLWGDDDRLIPPAHGRFYADHIPGAQLEILPSCGHMAPFEKTRECVEKTTAFVNS